MIALISIGTIALLGLIWWWVVTPPGSRDKPSRDVPLPLYTTRGSRSAVGAIVPALSRAPLAAAATPEAPEAPAPSPAPPSDETGTSEAGPRHPRGTTIERVFTTVPWVEPDVAASAADPAKAVSAGTGSNGSARASSNGHGTSADNHAAAAVPSLAPPASSRPVFPAPRTATPPSRVAAPRLEDPAADAAARWGPPPAERDPASTVQFLPGRLEVLQGRSMEGQEIRFVRPDRPAERTVVTFGRGEGAPYRHVQLKVPTVSRLHARMSQEPGDDRWSLENLSSTNPVAVNGADLAQGTPPVVLADGDRVEMGEVVFIFRAR